MILGCLRKKGCADSRTCPFRFLSTRPNHPLEFAQPPWIPSAGLFLIDRPRQSNDASQIICTPIDHLDKGIPAASSSRDAGTVNSPTTLNRKKYHYSIRSRCRRCWTAPRELLRSNVLSCGFGRAAFAAFFKVPFLQPIRRRVSHDGKLRDTSDVRRCAPAA